MTVTAGRPDQMHVQLPGRPLTLDDVAQLAAADESHRYELVEGNLLVMPPADAEHAALITRLIVWLAAHGLPADMLLPTPGLRIAEQTTGRIPDLLVLRDRVAARTVWIEPVDVALAVEVVSPGSQKDDRLIEPIEYARVGIPHFWRVERDNGAVTVHMYQLGLGEQGERTYLGHQAVPLDTLVAGEPPKLA